MKYLLHNFHLKRSNVIRATCARYISKFQLSYPNIPATCLPPEVSVYFKILSSRVPAQILISVSILCEYCKLHIGFYIM